MCALFTDFSRFFKRVKLSETGTVPKLLQQLPVDCLLHGVFWPYQKLTQYSFLPLNNANILLPYPIFSLGTCPVLHLSMDMSCFRCVYSYCYIYTLYLVALCVFSLCAVCWLVGSHHSAAEGGRLHR